MQRPNLADRAPAVSVIIPVYNAARYVSETLDSLFAQTFTDFETILVNDGSPDTDELERVLRPYLSRLIYLKQENRGPSAARNAAIKAARGEYVGLLDSDDTWMPDFLTEQMKALRQDSSIDLIYSDALLFGDSPLAGRTFMQSVPSHKVINFESLLRWETSIITTCTVVRRQALIDAGLFDEGFFRSEDFDLWMRLAHRGGRFACLRQVLARHRLHGASLAADKSRMIESQVDVYQKLLRTLPLSPDMRELMTAQMAKCQAYVDLERGKRQLLAGDFDQASETLSRAYGIFKSTKLRLILLGLRVAPDLLRRIYRFQQHAPTRG